MWMMQWTRLSAVKHEARMLPIISKIQKFKCNKTESLYWSTDLEKVYGAFAEHKCKISVMC